MRAVALLAVLVAAPAWRHRAIAGGAGGQAVTVPLQERPEDLIVDPFTGHLFVSVLFGRVLMFDRAGHLLRSIGIGERAAHTMALDPLAHLLLAGPVGTYQTHPAPVAMIDTRTGALVGSIDVGAGLQRIAVDAQAGRAVAISDFGRGGTTGAISVLDTRSGRLLRQLVTGAVLAALAVDVRAGRALVVGAEGGVWVLDVRTGRLLRTTHLAGFPSLVALDEGRGRAFVAAARDGEGGIVSVLDTRTGALIAAVPVPGTPTSLVVDPERGVAATVGGTEAAGSIFSLVDTDGRLLHVRPLGRSLGLLAGPAGRLVARSVADGTVSLVDSRTGSTLRTIHLHGVPLTTALDPRTGRLYVAMQPTAGDRPAPVLRVPTKDATVPEFGGRVNLARRGTIVVLDGRTGQPLRTIQAGVLPAMIALDPAHHRLVAIDQAGDDPGLPAGPVTSANRGGLTIAPL